MVHDLQLRGVVHLAGPQVAGSTQRVSDRMQGSNTQEECTLMTALLLQDSRGVLHLEADSTLRLLSSQVE